MAQAAAPITAPITNPTENVTAIRVRAYAGLNGCTCKGELSIWILKIKSKIDWPQPSATITIQQRCKNASDSPPAMPFFRCLFMRSDPLKSRAIE